MGMHIPVRECICCRNKSEKKDLIRVVKSQDGFFVDTTQKKQGRGAYLCRTCVRDANAFKKRPLDRAFRQKVPEQVYTALAEFAKGLEQTDE